MKVDTGKFEIGDRVTVDGDGDLKFTVTAFLYRSTGLLAELSWVFNGDIKTAWVELWRIGKVGAPMCGGHSLTIAEMPPH